MAIDMGKVMVAYCRVKEAIRHLKQDKGEGYINIEGVDLNDEEWAKLELNDPWFVRWSGFDFYYFRVYGIISVVASSH